MVMAGTESMSGPSTDEPLSSRMQWLRQRREALQDKLAQKNNELKTLCIEEAELTGVLPPEIPLEPGESPPAFRKRVGTSFSYPQNLVNKLKTNEAEESALEIDRQVQVGIQEAALIIINDPTENKAVRRKHRLIYQQSKQRLQEIDACLNFIRQSHGLSARQNQPIHPTFQNSHNSKHRTKKPRPPLDNLGREKNTKHEARGSLQDQGGISLSPLGPEHSYNLYSREYQDVEGHQFMQPGSSNPNLHRTNYIAGSPVDARRNNSKYPEHDFNVNNNVYILPDQYRPRTYSQGAQNTNPLRQGLYQDIERPYRPVPNTFTEEERQYRQMQLQKLELHSPPYSEHSILRHLDNDSQRRMIQTQYYESEYSPSRFEQTAEPQPYGKASLRHRRDRDHQGMSGIERKHHSAIQPNVDSYLPPGYWMRLEDDIVWCPEEQSADRFGSLDRRKHNSVHYPNSEIQSRYHTVSSGSKNTPLIAPRQYPSQAPISPSEHVPSNRILLRTQSLGSVETWHAAHDLSDSADNMSRKGKEKEWYETSLDSRCSPSTIPPSGSGFAPSLVRRPSQNIPPSPAEIPATIRESVPEPPVARRPRELPVEEQPQCFPISSNVYHERPKVLEIPAESKPSHDNGNEQILSFNSPTNHTVVQQGKYQPYREVTKPFEMSDFYKYSTKFRKRNEAASSGINPNSNVVNANTSDATLSQNTGNDKPRRVSPVQKSNYQPPQRKPQMYVLR